MESIIQNIRQNWILYFTFLLGIVSILGWNDILALRAEEPRRAIVAMEMVISGDYLIPKINAWPYYNKPPLFNWVLAFFFKLFGSFDEWVVRLPALLSTFLLAFINFKVVKHYLNQQIALWSSLIFLTFGDFLFYGFIYSGEIDLFFSLIFYLQIISIFHFHQKQAYTWMFVFSYVFCAIGVLTKGLSIGFQIIALMSWLFYHRQFKLFFSLKHLLGIFVFTLLTGSYFYFYHQKLDASGFVINLFNEASEKSMLGKAILESVTSFLSFPFFVFKLLLPWSVFILFFFKHNFISKIKSNPLMLFFGLVLIFNILPFWFSHTQRSRYLYIFFPIFANLLAYAYYQRNDLLKKLEVGFWKFVRFIPFLLPILFVVSLFIPQIADNVDNYPVKAAILIVMSLFILWLRKVSNQQPILYLALLLFFGRMGMNFIAFPISEKKDNNQYKEEIAKIKELIGKEPLIWYHPEPLVKQSKKDLFNNKRIETAALLPYQVPYYYTKSTNNILVYDTTISQEAYYLARSTEIDTNQFKPLYRFEDRWLKHQMVVFRNLE